MNINNYVEQYKNATFKDVPFNEVDNVVFCALSYIEWDGIITKYPLPLNKAVKKFFSLNRKIRFQRARLLKSMAESKRYRHVLLANYVNISDPENQQQFSALSIYFQPKKVYVAYRGTDSKIYSWKEDFNMSFLFPIPAQISAVNYLVSSMTAWYNQSFQYVIGGHSKGGNLAIYAAVTVDNPEKISLVFNNDGPGFKPEFISTVFYQSLKPKMITIQPQGSIVGKLFNNEIDTLQIFSDETNPLDQHNLYSWQVNDTHFIREENPSDWGIFFEESMNTWGEKMTLEQKVFFINTFYDILLSLEIQTISDISKNSIPIIRLAIEKFSEMELEEKNAMIEATKALVKSTATSFFDIFIKGKQD